MEKLFIIDGAQCMCKFGASPGILKVKSQEVVFININKKIATSLDIGDTFQPPAFGICNFSFPSKPCKVSVTQWSCLFKKIKVISGGFPLLPDSKAFCAIAGSECIEIVQPGQIEILKAAHTKNATNEFQNDLNPTSDSSGIDEMNDDLFILRQ